MKTNYIFPLLYFYLFDLDISINTSSIYVIYINRICSMKILWQETKKKAKQWEKDGGQWKTRKGTRIERRGNNWWQLKRRVGRNYRDSLALLDSVISVV